MRHNILKKNKDGTVLFTVICVMMVMIVVLMSTFIVVAASQKKALANYTDSQSYVTAKSVVDAYVACLEDTTKSAYDVLRNNITTGLETKSAGEYIEVSVGLPTSIKGFGEIIDGKIKVYKVSDTEYKIVAKTIDNESTNTVSRNINLTPIITPSVWDSAAKALDGMSLSPSATVFGGSGSNNGTMTLSGFGGSTSSLFYVGDIIISDSGNPVPNLGGAANLSDNQSIVTLGNFELRNDVKIYSQADGSGQIPFLYAGGEFFSKSNLSIGAPGKPINIICHGGEIQTGITQYGNIYSDGDFKITDANTKIIGDIYVDGNLNINMNNIQNADSETTIRAKFGGTICYSGTATSVQNKINSMRANGNPTGALVLESIFKQDTSLSSMDLKTGPSADPSNSDEKRIIISLPGTGASNVILPTQGSVFGNCYETDGVTPKTTENFLGSKLSNFSGLPAIVLGDPITGSSSIPGGTYSETINISSGSEVNLNFTGGNYSGEIVVSGDGKLNIYSSGNCNLQNLKLVTQKTKDMINSGDEFKIGNHASADLTKPPNIYWYVASGTTLTFDSIGSGENLLNCYLYAVGSVVNANSRGIKININNSGTVINNVNTSIIGSIIAQNIIENSGGTAFVYIDPNAGSPTPASNFLWTPTIYTNH